jgi:hypothetical protein
VKNFAPLIAAGASFTAILGLCLVSGIWLAARTGKPLFIFAGLLTGLALSAASAVRLLLR